MGNDGNAAASCESWVTSAEEPVDAVGFLLLIHNVVSASGRENKREERGERTTTALVILTL
jgi:hypothetical protein